MPRAIESCDCGATFVEELCRLALQSKRGIVRRWEMSGVITFAQTGADRSPGLLYKMATRGEVVDYILASGGFTKVDLNDLVSFLEKDGDYSLEGDALDACRHDMGLFIVKTRQRWDKAGRHRSRFRTQNQEWLKVPAMNKPLTPTVSSCRSLAGASGGCGPGTSRDRSRLSFSERSVRSKRRDTSSLVQLSADKLLHAAKRRLRAEGQNDLSFVIKQAAATPTRPAKVRRLLRRPPNQPVMYTPEEALRLFVDGNFTKNSWQLIRSSARDQHANIYPSYHEIHAAKVQCCPDGIHVKPEAAEVPLQNLLPPIGWSSYRPQVGPATGRGYPPGRRCAASATAAHQQVGTGWVIRPQLV